MDSLDPAPIVLDAVRTVARADVARCLARAPALREAVRLATVAAGSDPVSAYAPWAPDPLDSHVSEGVQRTGSVGGGQADHP
jgi:hypothetical protein